MRMRGDYVAPSCLTVAMCLRALCCWDIASLTICCERSTMRVEGDGRLPLQRKACGGRRTCLLWRKVGRCALNRPSKWFAVR